MIQKSTNLKRTHDKLKSFNASNLIFKKQAKIIKTSVQKDDYYIQISPRLETKNLTFTNSIKKVKIHQNNESSTEISVQSSLTFRNLIIKQIPKLNNLNIKGQYYFNMKFLQNNELNKK